LQCSYQFQSDTFKLVLVVGVRHEVKMYTNPFNRKHSTIRQVLDRILDTSKKPIRRSESVSSSGSGSSKSSSSSLGGHGRGILQWGRK
jgi:hypothetical protein